MPTSNALYSIILTACGEQATVSRAINAFLSQALPPNWELWVVCPDDETAAVANRYVVQDPRVKVLRDEGKGKPAALNLAFGAVQGDILVLSDGDVYVGPDSVRSLLAPFADPRVGIVSGHPVSLSPRNTMLGYWSHLLVDAGAHRQRLRRAGEGAFLECSGYLYALRRALVQPIPEDSLAEDGLVSHRVWEHGYLTAYAPEALVYVKYPTSYQDWISQKIRSMGGYAQGYVQASRGMRSFRREVSDGARAAIEYARSPKELWWTLVLFMARMHVWLRVWWDVKCRKRPFGQVWRRVNSTK